MKLRYLTFSYLILSLLFCGCSLTSQQLNLVGAQAPVSIYYPLDSSPQAISTEMGKVVVLAFWDSNCHHCQREIPKLDTFAKSFSDNKNIKFIAISLNSASEEASLRFAIQNLGLTSLSHAFSGNDIYDESFQAYKGEAIPYFVVIDKKGIVSWVGNDAEDLRSILIEILRLKP